MMGRILFYAGEAFLLAIVAGIALLVASRGLRRMGLDVAARWLVTFVTLWGTLFVMGAVGGELVGPEFLAAYRVTGLLAAGAMLLWLASIPLSRVISISRRPNGD